MALNNFLPFKPFNNKFLFMRFFSIFIFIIILQANTFAQTDSSDFKKNEFRMEFLNFIGSSFYAEYERFFCENKGINFVIAPTVLDNNEKKQFGILVQINPKLYYPTKNTEKTKQYFYFSPYLNYRYIDITEYNNYYNNLSYIPEKYNYIANIGGAGILIGLKTEFSNFFVLNIETGGGMRYVLNTAGNVNYDRVKGGFNNWNMGYSGIFPRINVTLGFKF